MTNERSDAERGGRPRRTTSPAWYLVLAIPLVGTLIPPIYNTKDPTVIGIPFFYWYLLLWVGGSVICTLIFYRGTRGER